MNLQYDIIHFIYFFFLSNEYQISIWTKKKTKKQQIIRESTKPNETFERCGPHVCIVSFKVIRFTSLIPSIFHAANKILNESIGLSAEICNMQFFTFVYFNSSTRPIYTYRVYTGAIRNGSFHLVLWNIVTASAMLQKASFRWNIRPWDGFIVIHIYTFSSLFFYFSLDTTFSPVCSFFRPFLRAVDRAICMFGHSTLYSVVLGKCGTCSIFRRRCLVLPVTLFGPFFFGFFVSLQNSSPQFVQQYRVVNVV